MDDMCTACLCTGRKLYFIGETGHYHLYSQILNEIPVYDFSDVCVRVCWECRAVLRRFGDFKALVKRSYSDLLQQVHQNIPPSKSSLIRPPHLQIQHVLNICYPDNEVKEEIEREDPREIDNGIEIQRAVEEIRAEAEEIAAEIPMGDVKVEVEVDADDGRKKKSKSKKVVKEKSKKPKIKVKIKKKKRQLKTKKAKKDLWLPTTEESELKDIGSDDGGCDNNDEIGDGEENNEEINNTDKNIEHNVAEKEECAEKPPAKGPSRTEELQYVGDKPVCGECGKVFSSKKTYRYHLNTLHKGQNRYPCPRCGKVYQWKSNLGRHMRSHKAVDNGELYCETCDRRFASVATYRQHLKVSRRHVAENDFSFVCVECGKRFVNKTRLRDHVDWEHLNKVKFRCQICDNKPFKCHTSLYVHMQNVHNSKKKENLCHICGKSYLNAAKLKYHIVAMHTSETPYACGQCGAAFGWYSSLYRHTREVHHKMRYPPKSRRKPRRGELVPLDDLMMPPNDKMANMPI